MDSVTQIALGGAIGALVGGKKYGRKAVLAGAICGTLPDLDALFLQDSDPVTQFTYHRGISHSFLLALGATPAIGWLFSKIKWFGMAAKDWHLYLLVGLCFITHILLDSLTIYGTQLFWPLESIQPIGLGSVFIIDPLYTLPLIFGLSWFLAYKTLKPVQIALVISTLYLLWGIGIQYHVHGLFKKSYHAPYDQVLIQSTPFNSFLWRVLVMKENGYEVGYYSIFDKDKNIRFINYNSKPSLLEDIKDSSAVQRLQWFTKGFYKVKIKDNKILMIDLRMGLEPHNYIFGFAVGEKVNGLTIPIEPERYADQRGMGRLSNVWDRIWNEKTKL